MGAAARGRARGRHLRRAGGGPGLSGVLEVRRDALDVARVASDGAVSLGPGEVLARVDRVGLTANVLTYATLGDALRYWSFFPASEAGWGRPPAWGTATVLDGGSDAVAEGERLFGLFPIASDVVLLPRAHPAGVVDAAEHRRGLPGAYNAYRTPGRGGVDEELELLLRPLFLLCFGLADWLRSRELFGAERVVVSSASSKTALGLTQQLSDLGVPVVGLTSAGKVDWVSGLGLHAAVLPYEELGALAADVPAVYVDVAGDPGLRRRVHEHLGARLRHSAVVGVTHGDPAGFAPEPGLPGPAPELFFVPDWLRGRTRDWGQADLDARVDAAFARFATWAGGWLRVRTGSGGAAVLEAWEAVRSGAVAPDEAHVVMLGADG